MLRQLGYVDAELNAVSKALGESSSLAVLEEDQVLYVARAATSRRLCRQQRGTGTRVAVDRRAGTRRIGVPWSNQKRSPPQWPRPWTRCKSITAAPAHRRRIKLVTGEYFTGIYCNHPVRFQSVRT
jgi:DNA-binding IclR family transcriptional regulator